MEELTCDTNSIGPHSDPVIPNGGLRRQCFRMLKLIRPGETLLDAVSFEDSKTCGDGDNEHMILNHEGNCYRYENLDAKLISAHNP